MYPPGSMSPRTALSGKTRSHCKHDNRDGRSVTDAKFVEDFLNMRFFRRKTEVKHVGDLLIGQATDQKPRDLILSLA
jgi:hypothetical protein